MKALGPQTYCLDYRILTQSHVNCKMVLNNDSLKFAPLYLAERDQDQLKNTTELLMDTSMEQVCVDS